MVVNRLRSTAFHIKADRADKADCTATVLGVVSNYHDGTEAYRTMCRIGFGESFSLVIKRAVEPEDIVLLTSHVWPAARDDVGREEFSQQD